MKTHDEICEIGRSTILEEARAVSGIADLIDASFSKTVELIFSSKGKVILTGIGKSAIIGMKISSTLNSTGTPSVFMHAGDAIHGDIGTIMPEDIVIIISKSGNSPEIKLLIPILKDLGNKLIGIAGNLESDLALFADLVLNSSVVKEACPNNLAPTSSTMAQLAIGDALAVALLHCRNFSSKDFARFHPGGILGKQLYLKISDIFPKNHLPMVQSGDTINKVIMEISGKRLGMTSVTKNNELVGIITDGDLRRMMETGKNIQEVTASEIMSKNPKTIAPETLAIDALSIMKGFNITQLIVAVENKPIGVVHLHDLLREGLA